MKHSVFIHPFLFALFPILFLFSQNIEQISYSEIMLPSLIVLGFASLLVFLIKLVIKDSKKTAIIVSLALILFFSFGHVLNLIRDWHITTFRIDRQANLLDLYGLLFIIGAYSTIKTRRDLGNFTRILNVVALSLVVISLLNITVYNFKSRSSSQHAGRSMNDGETTAADLRNVSGLRDVYYIILDGYASLSTLKEVYDYDNRPFIDFLTKRGFFAASDSRSNYVMTFLSLSSSLNLEYVNFLSDTVGAQSQNLDAAYQLIKNSKVMNFLKVRGYKFIHFGSGWGPTDRNINADLDYHDSVGNELLMVFIQTTMLMPFQQFFTADAQKRMLNIFSEIADVNRVEGPKFIFAHIIAPHPPYLFGANGETVPDAKLKMRDNEWKQKKKYLNQLIFVNKKVEIMVDEILKKSKFPPIIILQADHGPASTFYDIADGWERPTECMLRERTGILNAYYLPSGGKGLLYDTITPVNTFRLIFNYYFNANYEILPDRNYYSTYERPYQFVNVTARVKSQGHQSQLQGHPLRDRGNSRVQQGG